MPDSFHKKENNKKKVLKKKIKDQKKEGRKVINNKGKGFESMIAYADENGHLGPTPPAVPSHQPGRRAQNPSPESSAGNVQRTHDNQIKR